MEIDCGQMEITKAEYDRLLEETKSRCSWVVNVCADPAAINLRPVSDAELGGMIRKAI